MKKMFLLYLLIILIEITFVNADCIDTDGGIDYYTKGVITYYDYDNNQMIKEDFCLAEEGESKNEKILIEYYCKKQIPGVYSLGDGSTQKLCEEKCENGACTEDPPEYECPSYGGLSLQNKSNIEYFNGKKYEIYATETYDEKPIIKFTINNQFYEGYQYSELQLSDEIILRLGVISGSSAVATGIQYCFMESKKIEDDGQMNNNEIPDILDEARKDIKNKKYLYYILGGIILVVITVFLGKRFKSKKR